MTKNLSLDELAELIIQLPTSGQWNLGPESHELTIRRIVRVSRHIIKVSEERALNAKWYEAQRDFLKQLSQLWEPPTRIEYNEELAIVRITIRRNHKHSEKVMYGNERIKDFDSYVNPVQYSVEHLKSPKQIRSIETYHFKDREEALDCVLKIIGYGICPTSFFSRYEIRMVSV